MLTDYVIDLEARLQVWRCTSCGDVMDAQIRHHRVTKRNAVHPVLQEG